MNNPIKMKYFLLFLVIVLTVTDQIPVQGQNVFDPKAIILKAKGGDPESIFTLGNMYNFGRFRKHNPQKAFEKWKLAAEKGHPKAQHNIAHMYFYGEKPAAKDVKLAFEWWKKSSKQGYVLAQRYLGKILLKGYDDIPQNIKKGIKLLKKSADKNDALSQYKLGQIYSKGLYNEKIDLNLGKDYFTKASLFYQKAEKRLKEINQV